MRLVEVSWPARHGGLPPAHGYPLFSSLCRAGLVFHGQPDTQVLPIGSRLTLRMPEDRAWRVAGCGLDRVEVNGVRVELGPPVVREIGPAASLYSPFVTIKNAMTGVDMRKSCMKQLDHMGLSASPVVGCRRVARVAGRMIVGFPVRFVGLSARDSIAIQSRGLGGRNRMAMGVFTPC